MEGARQRLHQDGKGDPETTFEPQRWAHRPWISWLRGGYAGTDTGRGTRREEARKYAGDPCRCRSGNPVALLRGWLRSDAAAGHRRGREVISANRTRVRAWPARNGAEQL